MERLQSLEAKAAHLVTEVESLRRDGVQLVVKQRGEQRQQKMRYLEWTRRLRSESEKLERVHSKRWSIGSLHKSAISAQQR